MRLERLTVKGFMRFSDVVSLDLRALPPGLVAVVGQNGAGKTTWLESALAAVHRSFPSRDDKELAAYATGRDSYLDLEFSVDGRGLFRARVNVDGVKRTTDAVLEQIQTGGMRQAMSDGKVSTFDAAIAELLPDPDLMLASTFAAQDKSGSFTRLSKSERKALFMRLLGIERYEAMSKTAKDAAGMLEQARARLLAVRDRLAADVVALSDLDAREAGLRGEIDAAQARQAAIGQEIATLESRAAALADTAAAFHAAKLRAETARHALTKVDAERARLELQDVADEQAVQSTLRSIREKAATARADIESRITNNRDVLSQADAIQAAIAETATLDTQIADLREQLRTVHAAREALNEQRQQLRAQQHALDLAGQQLARARQDAATMQHVPCHGQAAFIGCQFLTQAAAAVRTIQGLEEQVAGGQAVAMELSDLASEIDTLTARGKDLDTTIATSASRRMALAPLVAKADRLASAQARVEELQAQLAAIGPQEAAQAQTASDAWQARQHERAAALQRLSEDRTQVSADLDAATADQAAAQGQAAQALSIADAISKARQSRDNETARIGVLTAGLTDIGAQRVRLARLQAEIDALGAQAETLASELLEWQVLAKALGRDGLAVLEIDNAGPTISAYTNELLGACFGTRFTVELVTQDSKAGGKGVKEDFTVKVFDNEAGGDARDIADLSGGEQVIVSEALMNAIAAYVNTTSAKPVRTCWRDETTGALDPENARRYLAMLRKVQVLGGFHHIFFVSHNPEASAMADAQIVVANGQASIALPPFSDAA